MILFLLTVALLAIAIVALVSRFLKLSLIAKVVSFIGTSIGIVCLVLYLSTVSSYFSFDFVHGGDHQPSRSATREESIKRGVFLCDIKLVPSVFQLNDTMSVELKEAWIENEWARGTWFWTTYPSPTEGYNITMIVKEIKGSWSIYRGVNQEYLYYDNSQSELSGSLQVLLNSDTLKYFVLKEDKMNFEDSDVIGKIQFVLGPRADR